MMPSEPGVTGTPAARAVARAVFLSPIMEMTLALGPMNLILHLSHTSANSSFSERKPYPGWMASTLAISAALMMRLIFR